MKDELINKILLELSSRGKPFGDAEIVELAYRKGYEAALVERTTSMQQKWLEQNGIVEPVPQTSGPQCKRCGAFTTYKRVETHGLCMKCEGNPCLE